ncbi:hypothetical protein ACSSS7_005952 [Eimeria intestinalis]
MVQQRPPTNKIEGVLESGSQEGETEEGEAHLMLQQARAYRIVMTQVLGCPAHEWGGMEEKVSPELAQSGAAAFLAAQHSGGRGFAS